MYVIPIMAAFSHFFNTSKTIGRSRQWRQSKNLDKEKVSPKSLAI